MVEYATWNEDSNTLINNRQNGRRRGRGGAQVRGPGGNGQDRGNRIDNRARGNAVQLHEKYKNLARDAQTQGDRVMTEYYLQFADHYFRVLSESRSRFDEQNQHQQRRPRYEGDDFDDQGLEGEIGNENSDGSMQADPRRYEQQDEREHQPRHQQPYQQEGRRERQEREPRQERQPREPRRDREQAPAEATFVAEAPEPAPAVEEIAEAPRPRRGRPRKRPEAEAEVAAPRSIDADRLPPAFAPADAAPKSAGGTNGHGANDVGESEGEAPAAPRRRRARRTGSEDSTVAA